MTDLKKTLINQVEQLLQKGELKGPEYRTLVTKIELASPKFLEMAMKKFESIRKSMKEEEEAVKKAGAEVGESMAPSPKPAAAPASAPAKAAAPAGPGTFSQTTPGLFGSSIGASTKTAEGVGTGG